MKKQWILVMDSGSGGEYTLNKIKQLLPNENYLFFKDVLNCPYGNKSKKQLQNIALKNIKKIIQLYDIKIIILACNTLGSATLDFLKQYVNIPIFAVEPYLNCEVLKKPTLLLATNSTIKHSRKIAQYKGNKNLFLCGFSDLAKRIDDCNKNYNILQPYLNKKLKPFRNKFLDNVVLGCTHFNYIKNQIESSLKTRVDFYEDSENIALQTKEVLQKNNMLCVHNKHGCVLTIYTIN